mgnify:CR=1 FL=1
MADRRIYTSDRRFRKGRSEIETYVENESIKENVQRPGRYRKDCSNVPGCKVALYTGRKIMESQKGNSTEKDIEKTKRSKQLYPNSRLQKRASSS